MPERAARVLPLWVFPAGAAAVTVGLGWRRRWVSDDGYITLRTVQQLLHGHGPVFNVGQRIESSTSTLWVYVLALVDRITPGSLPWTAVVLGLLLTALGVAAAVDGSRRLAEATSGSRAVLPAGILVVLALPPFWDFTTSGLETGLTFAWLGCSWWLLVRLARGKGRPWLVAATIGLGPLVRPDAALVSAVLLLALLVVAGRTWRRAVPLLAVATALPLAYEIFRAGYYATLTPTPALTKEGTTLRVGQGLRYLRDLAGPYVLVVPLVVLAVVGVLWLVQHRDVDVGLRVVAVAPCIGGVLSATYLVAIGGDFMHGRLLLPALFALVMPVAVVPVGPGRLQPAALTAVAITAAWAVLCVLALRPGYLDLNPAIGPDGIADERRVYSVNAGSFHPVSVADYRNLGFSRVATAAVAAGDGGRTLVLVGPGEVLLTAPLASGVPGRLAVAYGNIGLAGQIVPLDARLEDLTGLAQAVGARLEILQRGRPGHEKVLPLAWVVAMDSPPGAPVPDGVAAADVEAARAALACGQLAELVKAVSQPLTPARFLRNLAGAPRWTRLRVPADPSTARARFCDRRG